MSDDNPAEGTPNSLKRTRSSSLPTESQDQVGDESQLSTFSIDDEISCGICLGVLESPYTVIPCLHTFDKDCLAGWWKQNNTCPLCKIKATSGRHSFQLQAIVNHYDNKRPPRKRAKGSDEDVQNNDRAELYPFGVVPPPPGANHGHRNDDENEEIFGDFDDEDGEHDEDDEDNDDDEDLLPGGRLVFPCPACRPGHPSGYTCPHPIPEPTEAMKRTEKEDYFNGRREVVAPARGQPRIPFAEGLHTLPGAGLVFQDHEIAEINRACEDHLACHACNAYVPRNWPRGVESICRLCSRATCMLFDPQQCPRPWDDQWLSLRTFNEAGRDVTVEGLWHRIAARYPNFEHNPMERDRFVAVLATNNGINPVVVELMTSAGHAAEPIGPFYCKRCVEGVATDRIEEWWNANKAGALPAEITNLPKCWYGRECRTQRHNIGHAQRFNHDCDPRPQPQAQPQPQPDPQPQQAAAAAMPPPPPPAPQPQAQPPEP